MQGMAKTNDIPTRTRPIRRLNASTIEEIARFCARNLTESEACRQLGINPRVWFNWKEKHNRKGKFTDQLERLRAIRIDVLLDRIEKCAEGVNMKQPDWRAAAHLLTLTDYRRFSASAGTVMDTAPQRESITLDRMREIMAMTQPAPPANVVDCEPVKQLGEAGADTPP